MAITGGQVAGGGAALLHHGQGGHRRGETHEVDLQGGEDSPPGEARRRQQGRDPRHHPIQHPRASSIRISASITTMMGRRTKRASSTAERPARRMMSVRSSVAPIIASQHAAAAAG
jgi:hypothetical protein